MATKRNLKKQSDSFAAPSHAPAAPAGSALTPGTVAGAALSEFAHTTSLDQQLIQINERVRMHAQRLWQLPFAYLGVLGLLIQGFTNATSPRRVQIIAGCFTLIGVFVGWAMGGAVEGIYRGVRALARVEQLLKLPPTAKASPMGQYLPYFLLLIVGTGLAAATCVRATASLHEATARAAAQPAKVSPGATGAAGGSTAATGSAKRPDQDAPSAPEKSPPVKPVR